MSWESKQDYCGLAVEGKIICKASTANTTGQYLEKLGAHGDFAATKPFGVVSSPSNDYTIEADHVLSGVKLGQIKTVDGKKYALASIHYETAAGAEPVLNASAVQVEDGATTEAMNTYALPDIQLATDEIAVIIAGAATLEGSGCELVRAAADFACTVSPHNVNGYPVASDVKEGRITVQLTIGQYGNVVPTVAAAQGWDVSAPLTCADPDSDFPEWTCTLSKPLVKTVVSAASASSSSNGNA